MINVRTWGRAAFIASLFATLAPAFAQNGIGSATTVERDVSGSLAGRVRSVATGDNVFSNETIRTANASAAQLRFLDNTNIAIGPSASVVLDRFVYDPTGGGARAAAVRVTQGAMRWVSGSSESRAYSVRTPHVIIGVRGTSFDLLVERSRTTVTLNQGAISVCPIAAPRNCVMLTIAGQTVTATSRRVEGVRPNGPSPTDFADRCLRAIDRQDCVITARAEPVVAPVLAAPADLPMWNGFYVGAHGGYGRQQGTGTFDGFGPTNSIVTSIAAGNVPRSLGVAGDGGVGGVQAGYNLQVGQFVFGAETDIAYTRLGGSGGQAVNPFGVLVTSTTEQRLNWLGTTRGRVGVAFDRFLIFATGGLAYGGVKLEGLITGVDPTNGQIYPSTRGSRSDVRFGWSLGGGVEVAITPQISLKFDYLHYDLGSRTVLMPEFTGLQPGEFATIRARASGDIGRAGVNFRF